MKTKPEIREKLEQAENAVKKATNGNTLLLVGVVDALRWVLNAKITQEPKDPVTEE